MRLRRLAAGSERGAGICARPKRCDEAIRSRGGRSRGGRACVRVRTHAESAGSALRMRRPVRHARVCARAVRFGAREPRAPRTRHAAAPRRVRITGTIPDTAAARPPDRGARPLVQARAHQRRACVLTRVRADTAPCVCVCVFVRVCACVCVCYSRAYTALYTRSRLSCMCSGAVTFAPG